MNRLLTVGLLTILASCATGYDPQEVEAVRDYVSAAELVPVDRIRTNAVDPANYSYVNDYFVILSSRRENYLVELNRQCRDLRRTEFTPEMVDRRTDPNTLSARFDTIRGCRIETFYPVTDDQVKELKNLGDAPGEEIFLPDDQD